jgi:hypothetical protein
MRVRSQIILLAVLLFSCEKLDNHQHPPTVVDSVLIKSIENTNTFTLIIEDVDSVELELWKSVSYKLDSLIKRNRELEKKLGNSVRIIDGDGNVKNLGSLDDIKKRLRKN